MLQGYPSSPLWCVCVMFIFHRAQEEKEAEERLAQEEEKLEQERLKQEQEVAKAAARR
mgnify:CR=1 FL=1